MKENIQIIGAVIVGIIIIGGSVWYTNKNGGPTERKLDEQEDQVKIETSDIPIERVMENDRVRGAVDAPITIVQYSDTECPFCKRLHNTLIQVVNEYQGKVNWTFRHFPVHEKSIQEASSAECAGDVKGNDFFWQYIDKVFATTAGNNSLDLTLLPKFAEELDIDKVAFEKCLADKKFEAKINNNLNEMKTLGVEGTPFSVVFGKNGEKVVVGGAQPIEVFRKTIDFLLTK